MQNVRGGHTIKTKTYTYQMRCSPLELKQVYAFPILFSYLYQVWRFKQYEVWGWKPMFNLRNIVYKFR